MESVLIIDDDIELCSMLHDYLTPHGLSIAMKHHGIAGMEAARKKEYDMIVLDVMLPGMDGFEVLRDLRSWSDIGVLLLTARGEDADRINGLESGADDYLAKPFNPRELLARIRAILRRRKHDGYPTYFPTKLLQVDGLVLDEAKRTVRCHDRDLDLTDIEFSLMEAFLKEPGKVLAREYLVVRVLGRQFHPFDRSLDMHVSRLRRKLDGAGTALSRIKTIRNSGYLFA